MGRLSFHSHKVGDVAVIRCQGRIVAGPEVDALQAEVDKQTRLPGMSMLAVKKVVLQLAETEFVDSSGLGALVRLFGVLRAAGGDLKLCELSPFVLKVLQVTNLLSVFLTYATEAEAIEAFGGGLRSAHAGQGSSKTRIVCIDPSRDLLAYLDALLKRSGYEVFTTRSSGEAVTLISATRAAAAICGPGMMAAATGEFTVEKIRKAAPQVRILKLSADFSTAAAGDAGVALINNLQALLAG